MSIQTRTVQTGDAGLGAYARTGDFRLEATEAEANGVAGWQGSIRTHWI
jgi:hypothetical protein